MSSRYEHCTPGLVPEKFAPSKFVHLEIPDGDHEIDLSDDWALRLSVHEGRPHNYRISSIAPDDFGQGLWERFYAISCGPYGNPLIDEEPSLRRPIPGDWRLDDPKKLSESHQVSGGGKAEAQQIVGVVVIGSNGELMHRLSLTNAQNQGIEISFGDDRMVTVNNLFNPDDASVEATVRLLVNANYNRIRGLIAYAYVDATPSLWRRFMNWMRGPQPPLVLVRELEDLVLKFEGLKTL